MPGAKLVLHDHDAVLVSGSKELTDAGTAVALSSTEVRVRKIYISVNGGLANVGSSDAVATSDSEVGITIYPGNTPLLFENVDLSAVYAAGASGARLTWTYVV